MENTIIIETICPLCRKHSFVEVNEENYFMWAAGALAQDVFPYLSANERELLISGMCADCWKSMWGE